MSTDSFSFDVALSFAGEDREYVQEVADTLKIMGFRVFYDKYEEVTLWGKNLYTHLQEVYFRQARYTVMFISSHYKAKLWTNHERESAQARAFSEKGEYILPARFDETEIPGILPTTGYINLSGYTPKRFAELIKQKIGFTERTEFFPHFPDKLYSQIELMYDYLGITEDLLSGDRLEKIDFFADRFFEISKLMTSDERRVLAMAARHSCPNGLPDNVHLNLNYLGRLTSLSPEKLISMLSRLDCLQIRSRIYESDDHSDESSLDDSKQVIELIYEPLHAGYSGNATDVMVSIFDCMFTNLCETCAVEAVNRLNFSALGTLSGFKEPHS